MPKFWDRIFPRKRAQKVQRRSYQSATASRLTSGWNPSNSSADAELIASLTTMRARSRALCRDASYAKRARVLVVNNVIGTGIGMQAQVKNVRGTLRADVNQAIEAAWEKWCYADSCHTGGRLAFKNFERALMAQVFEAGEVFVRKHYVPFGKSEVPFTLELIEAERLADEFTSPTLSPETGNQIRMGIEVDRFMRPVYYHIRENHPGEFRFGASQNVRIEKVPAAQILHLAVVDRWPQTRGEPWMHSVLRRLNDMDGYSEAEIIRARAQAVRMGIIETPEDNASLAEEQADGSFEMGLETGVVTRLNPGEKWVDSNPTAPNPQLDPFMRYMLREMAAGTGVSYESLSRDYAQSNYSSSRLALLDDRDLWRFYQSWFICEFRTHIHREWLQQAVLAGAIPAVKVSEYAVDPSKFEAVRFKPRGWSWIDPTSEVEAYKEAIKAGLTTNTDVIAQTAGGRDIEDILEEREQELQMMKDKGLVFDTSPEIYEADAKKANADAKAALRPPEPPPDQTSPDDTKDPAPSRVFSFPRK